jgi:hypothetical protein
MQPATGAQVLVLTLLFFGGGVAGVLLPAWLAPGSFAAEAVGFFSFVVPFVIGMQAWLGLAIVLAVWGHLRRVRHPDAVRPTRADIPSGSFVFVPISTTIIGVAGLLIGFLGSSLGVIGTFALYLLLGLLYGTACWVAARSGYLPFGME